jgi:DNA-binding NtrC family response regulator
MESSLALVVMPEERRRALLHSLESLKFEILLVENCTEARRLLQTAPPVQVVITQVSLADGNWCDVLRFLVDSGMEASVVVTSPQADENLWSEVLWRGAYDLLIEPFERDEVRRTMEGALRARHSRENYYSGWAAAGRNL